MRSWWAVLLLFAFACSRREGFDAPRPGAIEPVIASNGRATPVVIRGSGFIVQPTQQIGGPSELSLRTEFRAWLGDVELEGVTYVDGATLTATVPAGLVPGAYPLMVQSPSGQTGRLDDAFFAYAAPSLRASAVLSQGAVNVGQSFWLELDVLNTGGVPAAAVRPGPMKLDGTGDATLVAPPPEQTIPARERRTFRWRFTGSRVGQLRLTAEVEGSDSITGERGDPASATSEPLLIQRPAALTGIATASPARVNAGQTITFVLDASNAGDADVLDAAATATATSPATRVLIAPSMRPIPGQGAERFVWQLEATGAGSLTFSATITGRDRNSGVTVLLPPVASAPVTVELPAALAASLAVPAALGSSTPFTVTMTVRNTGGATARAVVPSALAFGGSGSAQLVSGPSPASADLPGGGTQSFTWTYLSGTAGTVSLSGSASGTDANDGRALMAASATSNMAPIREVQQLFDDPFGDGTAFSFIVGYGGKVYLGPRKTGNGAIRSNPDGSAPESIAFAFQRDITGTNQHRNSSAAPFPSIGATGCVADTPACGPDNEDGRGWFFSGTIAGTEWLGIGGARSAGGFEYIYMSNDTATTLRFAYVDLLPVTGSATRGLSAAHVFNDRVYLGMPDNGGSRPYLVTINRTPTLPGLEAISSDVTYLDAHNMPGLRPTTSVSIIDTIGDFNNRLYVFNSTGGMRSTTSSPRPYGSNPGDWTTVTLNGSAATARTAVSTTKMADIEPADKAYPQMAAFNGWLYVARNVKDPTSSAPGAQLWVCDPNSSGSNSDCDTSDWILAAWNNTGDSSLSTFNNPRSTAIGMLVATSQHLYVGFNNGTDGVVVFRSKTGITHPTSHADFEGLGGCSAANHPASCEGLGGNGLSSPIATRIFAGAALRFSGTEQVYLTAGTGTSPVRVYRIPE